MNIDITYYHNRFRLSEYPTYAVLADLNTRGLEVRVEQPDIPIVRNMSEDGMRALIEAKQLPPAQADGEPSPGVGDLWATRGGDIVAVHDTVPGEDPERSVGFNVIVVTRGTLIRAYDVDLKGAYTRKGKGEQHRLDLVRRTGRFL